MSTSCGCSGSTGCCGSFARLDIQPHWVTGSIQSGAGQIPIISTCLTRRDRIGTLKVRWGIGRMRYTIPPGLYAAGQPDADSPVLVTANYKLTFDSLRSELHTINAWILVLDTKGINVWCAAGKGTFGTEELIHRIQDVRLDQVIVHQKIILPQLGAPGVAAHEVKKATGFKAEYGPIYAHDLPEYLRTGEVRPELRRVRFPLHSRLALVPMEFVPALKFIPVFLVWLLALQFIRDHRFSITILRDFIPYVMALISGSVLFQILLPWLPFRSFVLNGWLLGVVVIGGISILADLPMAFILPLLLILPPITAYLAVNFTGSTTFTSLSGVQKELIRGVPVMILSVLGGMAIQIIMVV